MKTSSAGRLFIETFEGKFNHAYDDGTGVCTIGYGHTNAAGPPPVKYGMHITDDECDSILASDLGKVEKTVLGCIRAPSQCQFDALVSFEFNTGHLSRSSIPEKINAGLLTSAMNTLVQYDHAGGRRMAGLTRRREAEKLMFEGKVAASLRLAGAHATTEDTPKMPQAPQLPPKIRPPTSLWTLFLSILRAIFRR